MKIEFTEIQNWGVNILTLTFVATLFFTSLQGYTLIKQIGKITRNKSGKSVSFVFFSIYTSSALAITIFGLYKSSLALTINGLLGFISLIILIKLFQFKKIERKEKILGLISTLTIPLVIIVPQKDILYLILGLVVLATIISQIVEIWKNRSSGSVYPGQTIVSIFSSLFWLIYALTANIWPMKIINSISFILWIALLLSYLKFREPKDSNS
ncbi:MAG: SemiSWEET family transporter [Patescibacteria group bacterium]|jgi:uncharacterized protein with PQ loop repeat